MQESACILTGLSYNGKDENGNELWDGCTNVRIWDYETSLSGQDIINSFNIQTNKWMGKYVFDVAEEMNNLASLRVYVSLCLLAGVVEFFDSHCAGTVSSDSSGSVTKMYPNWRLSSFSRSGTDSTRATSSTSRTSSL